MGYCCAMRSLRHAFSSPPSKLDSISAQNPTSFDDVSSRFIGQNARFSFLTPRGSCDGVGRGESRACDSLRTAAAESKKKHLNTVASSRSVSQPSSRIPLIALTVLIDMTGNLTKTVTLEKTCSLVVDRFGDTVKGAKCKTWCPRLRDESCPIG